MAREDKITSAPAATTWPPSSNEMQCNNTMSRCKSIPSYLGRTIGGGMESCEHVIYSGAVVTPSSSFSSPISCPPPSRSDIEHSYCFYEKYYNLSTQSMYERITEARKTRNKIRHEEEEEFLRDQLRKGSLIYRHIHDQTLSTASSGELKDKRREDEMFELEL